MGLAGAHGTARHRGQVRGSEAGRALGIRARVFLQGCLSEPGSQPWVALSSCLRFCHWLHFLQTDAAHVTHHPASRDGGAAVPAILLPGPSLPPPSQLPCSTRGLPRLWATVSLPWPGWRFPFGRQASSPAIQCTAPTPADTCTGGGCFSCCLLTPLLSFTQSSFSTAGASCGKPSFSLGWKKSFNNYAT